LIQIRHLTRRYTAAVTALDDVSLEIAAGEFVAITGPSGCGKSTLMHLIGGLDTPTSGEIFVDGLPLHGANDAQLTDYRRRQVGIIFQFFHLMPTMSVEENVCLPLLLRGDPLAQARARAAEIIDLVGLSDRAGHGVHQLSGGQLQRTAIARALVHDPVVLLADEPTGNLDAKTGREIIDLISRLNENEQLTIIMVTHDKSIAAEAHRTVRLREGRIENLADAA